MALRNGVGLDAFQELPRIQYNQVAAVALTTYQAGGVVVCHRNVTRFKVNAGIRAALGILSELPQKGEPLLVLKNSYDIELFNGESTIFDGWKEAPNKYEYVYDRWKHLEERVRFGATLVAGERLATLAIEELHGRLVSGFSPIAAAAGQWASRHHHLREKAFLDAKISVAPHLHANFGYCYTAHKSQGSQWPYVFVILEPSIRINEEDGRRWAYTAVTRAQQMTTVYLGNV